MRLFTGLDIPEEIIRRLEQLISRLKPAARIAWSPAANLHITTKFIGEWPEERLDELKSALAAVSSRSPIDTAIRSLGFFPNPRWPRNFWCGIEAPGLAELAAATEAATSSLGIASEIREYSPHLTLARIKERIDLAPLHQAIECESAGLGLDFGHFEVRSFSLYRSQMYSTGSVYTKLAEFPLTHS
ncbi:MAG TPA: RNA 2',3'-cyclic phosphodiesterase [Bryobacteraceae bacterium]|jgi:2'-5' RNA ligase|nr:RNA 2',3'-cyclic phosphodiesterase [Bryobacteraceae bacterium]